MSSETLFKIWFFDKETLISTLEKRFYDMSEATAWILDHHKDVPLIHIEEIV